MSGFSSSRRRFPLIRRRYRRLLGLFAILVILGSLPAVTVFGEVPTRGTQPAAALVDGTPDGTTRSAPPVVAEAGHPTVYVAPEPIDVVVTLASGPVRAASSPVVVGNNVTTQDAVTAAAVRVQLLDRATVARLGGQAIGFRLERADGVAADGVTHVRIDLAAIHASLGEQYASRLELWFLPDCYPVSPKEAECQPRRVPATNDYAGQTLSADVALSPSSAVAEGQVTGASSGGGGSYLLGGGAGGPFGNYGASGLAGSADWNVGLSSGNFSWSKQLTLPPTIAGPQPAVEVAYSSQSVDGMTSETNNQPSQVGLGWSVSTEAFIQQSIGRCSAYDPSPCGPSSSSSASYSISLLGQAGKLLKNNNSGYYHLEIDPGWKIETNKDGAAFRVTTPDGSRYYFGASTGATRQLWVKNSSGGDGTGDSYNPGLIPYRWMLDKIVDPSGNTVLFTWAKEQNRYIGFGADRVYDRGGYLTTISYARSSVSGGSYGQTVTFTYAMRCVQITNCPTPLEAEADPNYPDTPTDKWCDPNSSTTCPYTNDSQTFFSFYRLASVQTSVRTYEFTHSFQNAKLWLSALQERGGPSGTGLYLPAITFTGTAFNNRLPLNQGDPTMPLHRVTFIRDELSKGISITYGQPHPCSPAPGTSGPSNKDCWALIYSDWSGNEYVYAVYMKYLATSVTESDGTTAASPSITTTYTYQDSPAWVQPGVVPFWQPGTGWSEWRGHGKVLVETGSGTKTRTRYLFFRGIGGSVGWLGATGSCTGESSTATDSSWMRGQVREVQRLDGAGTVLSVERRFYSASIAFGSFFTVSGPRLVREAKLESAVGSAPCTVRRTEFDTQHGMPTKVRHDGEWATSGDERCLLITQLKNTTVGIVDKRSRDQYFANSNCSSSKYADVEYAYDGLSIGSNSFTRGLLTLEKRYADASTSLTTTYGYDSGYGRLTSVTDGNSNTTTTAYVPSTGLPTEVRVTDALGHLVKAQVDPGFGQPTRITDQRNKVTAIEYDLLGRRSKVWLPTEPDTGPETYRVSYYLDGGTTFPRTPARIQTSWLQDSAYPQAWQVFDGFGRLRQTQSYSPGQSGGRVVNSMLYDNRGLVAEEKAPAWAADPGSGEWHFVTPSGNSTKYTYDSLGRTTKTAWWASGAEQWATTTAYSDRTMTSTPPSGTGLEKTSTTLNAYGNPESVKEYTSASTYAETTYTHTPRDEIATITDALGNVISFSYDWLGRRSAMTHPDLGAWSYTYDGAGNLRSSTDALSKQLWTTYDVINRPTAIREDSDSGTLLAAFTYDASGYAGLPDASTRYLSGSAYTVRVSAYDDRSRPTQKQFVIPAVEGALSGTYTYDYTYTTSDQLKTVTLPAAGSLAAEMVTSNYSTLGYATSTASSLATYVTSTSYDDLGRVSGTEQGSGAGLFLRSFAYDPGTFRLQSLQATVAGVTQQNDQYVYDPAGQITRITDQVSGQRRCFSYDNRARLTHAWTTDVDCSDALNPNTSFGPDPFNLAYSYNDIGNLTAVSNNGTISSYTYNASGASSVRPHAVTAAGADSYGYNANGDMTTRTVSGTTSTLAWDAMRRLSSVTKNGQTTSFVYDASGQRLLRKDPGSTTLFIDGQELTLQGSAITVNRAYTHAGATVATRTVTASTNDLYWMSSDHQASFGLAVRASDGAISRQRYLPFGAPRGPQNQLPGERGYIGQVEDDGIGLIYLNARYYDAALGRFVSPDPLLVASRPESLNAYAYSGNSPIDRSDPGGALATDSPALGADCPNNWCIIDGSYVELPDGTTGYLREVKQPDGTFGLELCVRGPDAATYTCAEIPTPGNSSGGGEVQAAQCGFFCDLAGDVLSTTGHLVDKILDSCTSKCAELIGTTLTLGAAAACGLVSAGACLALNVAIFVVSVLLQEPTCVFDPTLPSCMQLALIVLQYSLLSKGIPINSELLDKILYSHIFNVGYQFLRWLSAYIQFTEKEDSPIECATPTQAVSTPAPLPWQTPQAQIYGCL